MSFINKLFSIISISIFFVTCIFNTTLATKAAPESLLPTSKVLCSDNTACTITGNKDFSEADDNGIEGVSAFIIQVARAITYITGGLAVLFLVYGGVRYLISSDEKGTGTARSIIRNAIIGLVIAILAYAIISIITTLLSGRLIS